MANNCLEGMSIEDLLKLYKENKQEIQELCREKEILELELNGGVISKKKGERN